MRDIRIDLKERLAILEGRCMDELVSYDQEREALAAAHRAALEAIKRERDAIEQLLAIENEREESGPLPIEPRRRTALMDFLLTKVSTHGPLSKDELRTEAIDAGYLNEGSGRAFHTTLMNIARGGKLIQLPDGRYAPPTSAGNLFNMGPAGDAKTIM